MTNGFYNTDNFSDIKIKKFVKESITKAYKILVETKYKNGIINREIDKELSIGLVIDNYFKFKAEFKTDRQLAVVDRFKYNQGQIKKELCEYEICLSYDWTFLYIFVNEDNFNKLIKKYNLKLKEWN